MDDEHPGLDAIQAAVEEDKCLRTSGRISDEAAMLRGVEDFESAELNEEWIEWAGENAPMTSYSVYGFDSGGYWSCVFVNEYSGSEPPTARPWRNAVGGEVEPEDRPHDPDQVSRYFAHGLRVVTRAMVPEEAIEMLDLDSSNVDWHHDEFDDGEAATVDEVRSFLDARMG